MKKLALLAIKCYQKFISPYKGFSCAYSKATKEKSCSCYGYDVINRFGVIKGLKLLKRRFVDCKICSENLNIKDNEKKLSINSQSGVLDCDFCASFLGDMACDIGCGAVERIARDLYCGPRTSCVDSFFATKSDEDLVEKRKEKVFQKIQNAKQDEVEQIKEKDSQVWPDD